MSNVEVFSADKEVELSSELLDNIKTGSLKNESDRTLELIRENNIPLVGIHPSEGLGGPEIYEQNDILNQILVLSCQKPGTDISATVTDPEVFDQHLRELNRAGLDCYKINENIEEQQETKFHTLRAKITKDKSWRNLKNRMDSLNNFQQSEFFGYPLEEAQAYVDQQRLDNSDFFKFQRLDEIPAYIRIVDSPERIAEEFGREDKSEKLSGLLNYMIKPNRDSLENAIEEVETRYSALENLEQEYDVNLTDLI